MSDFVILSDSSCDLPDSLLKEYNIELIPYYVSFDQTTYYKEREEITLENFYHILRNQNVFPKTSLPSVDDYMKTFIKYIQDHKNIICFCLTSKFSGSYQAAVNAKNILEEEYPEAKIEVINSIQATAGQGLIVLQAAKMKKAGYSMEDIIKNIEVLKETARITFFVDTLEYLEKGGRIGKVSALIGGVLNFKPLIVVKDGELNPYGKIRGRKKALRKIIEMAEEIVQNNFDSYEFCIAEGDCIEEAEALKSMLEEEWNIKIDLPFFKIGTTIGTNTGPDTIGICFIKKYDHI
ncbi:DegV family protein [Defluviitalea raffinosedens]|uniref:DegV family EDD domain-containing protein n=1 Tax=Defluviitalea raffinosedens TaxID=1450156 RepID=A0A7C8HEQ4_9FIRM|nr:DegV family protein [Defluviitalea raffinosedens]KAE9634489.1 DegV family EDD domain-containing protein [Defluviitalea raffinosedens]MBM7684716.1 DegV family protein with EDD domain [Defluviitalea raffinosedens]HHW66946.1 DegV family protein [Candidatus Epulonipiscium sp.]